MDRARGEQLNLWPRDAGAPELYRPEDYLLMSLQSEPWGRIVSGVKRYEYRHRFRAEPSVAFIYVTAPTARIEGVVALGSPIVGSAKEIGDLAERHISGNGRPVYEYFAPRDKGSAIPILGIKLFEPIALDQARREFDFLPPQAYMFLYRKPDLFSFLLERAGISDIRHPLTAGFSQ